MDKQELMEKQNNFSYKLLKITKKCKNKDKLDILNFYPNFNLKEPYTNFNPLSDNNLKPFQLLPFFKNIVIDIKPFKTENEFVKYYGMDVDQLLEQQGKEIFQFRLSNNYSDYMNLESDYLDDILDKNHPIVPLINKSYGCLLNGTDEFPMYDEYIGKNLDFGSILLGEMGGTDPLSIIAMDIMNGHSTIMNPFKNEDYTNIVIENLYKLQYCGYGEVVDFLKRFLDVGNGRLDWAFVFSNAYANFLSNPIIDSLNGTHLVNSQLKHVANDLSIRKFDEIFPTLNKSVPKIHIDNSMILSADIAREMVNSINMPTLMSMDDVDEYDNMGPIKALASLEKAIMTNKSDEILDLSSNLESELVSTSIIVKDMQSNIKQKSHLISQFSLGVGIMGNIASLITDSSIQPLFNLAGIVGGVGEFISDSKMTSYFLNKLNRINKENHVLYLYDNNDHVSLNLKNPLNSNNTKYVPFNDEITQKFEYYEYLYNNIPILSVLLDINTKQITNDISSKNGKINFFKLNRAKEINPHSKSKIFVKQLQLYGISYMRYTNEYSYNKRNSNLTVINPKYIRPIYKNGKIIEFKMLTEHNTLEFIPVNYIHCLTSPSIIEKNIFFFDWIYPQFTKIESRPTLIYDKWDIYQKEVEKNIDNPDKLKQIFKDSLKDCDKLENNYYFKVKFLMGLGYAHYINNEIETGIQYYEQAQKITEKCSSTDMAELDFELTNLIVGGVKQIQTKNR